MRSNNFSATRPNEEQANVPQSENLTFSQPVGSAQEYALNRLQSAITKGSDTDGQRVHVVPDVSISKEKPSPVQGDAQRSETSACDWRACLPRSLANPVPDIPLFLHGESIVMIRGTLVALKGRPKVGKSQFYGYLTAALLKDGEPIVAGGLRAATAGLKILIIDTEMTEPQGVGKVQLGFRTAGVPIPDAPSSDRVTILLVKSKAPADIRAVVEAAIADLRPDLVVLDGIVQMFPNFNDTEETNSAINWLKGLTMREGEPCVISVIHTNLSDKDTSVDAKMRGHLGTQLTHSADTIISISKKNRVFTAEIPDGRRPEDCIISWTIDNERGMYVPAGVPLNTKKAEKLADIFKDIQACMAQLTIAGKPTDKAHIADLYMKQTNPNRPSSTAYNHIAKCESAGLIECDPTTKNYFTRLISKEK